MKGDLFVLFSRGEQLDIMKTIQKDMFLKKQNNWAQIPEGICLSAHVNKKHWRESGPRLQGAADQDVHGWMMHVPDWWQHAYVMHHSLMTKCRLKCRNYCCSFVLRSGQRNVQQSYETSHYIDLQSKATLFGKNMNIPSVCFNVKYKM